MLVRKVFVFIASDMLYFSTCQFTGYSTVPFKLTVFHYSLVREPTGHFGRMFKTRTKHVQVHSFS